MNRQRWTTYGARMIGVCTAASLMAMCVALSPIAMGHDAVSNQDPPTKDKEEEKDAAAPRKGPRRTTTNARNPQAQKPAEESKEQSEEGLQIDPALQKQIDELLQDTLQREQAAQQQPEENPQERLRRLREERMQQRAPQMQPGALPGMPDLEAPEDSQAIDIPPNDDGIPPEARTYRFSIRDGTYDQLIEGFARQTGLGVIGDAPRDGRVNFVTTEELSFTEALSRVRMLMFNYKPHDPYWVERRDTHLEVIRVTDFYRVLPTERMFQSIEMFREAQLPPDELSLVIYTPRSGSVADLSVVRDFMPDYMRVTPLQDRNAVTIFGLVKDIEKYMSLKDIFTGDRTDPRTLARIEVVNLMPSEALEKLRQMTDIDGTSMQRPRAMPQRGQPTSPLDSVVEPPVVIIPEDMQGFLMVRAMQDKIEEIKSLLTFIDIPTPISDVTPEIIPLVYASADMLVQTLQQILAATATTPTPGAQPTPRARSPRRTARTPGTVSTDSVTLMPHPSRNAIIVLADSRDQVNRVRELVALFDVESKIGPLRIELSYADPTEVTNTVTAVLSGAAPKGMPGVGAMQMQIVPDPTGSAIWFSGSQAALDDVRSVIAALDLPAEPVSLHVYRLTNRLPSFVANVLREYDGAVLQPQSAAARSGRGSSARQPQRRVRRAAPVASKFTADDDEMRLLVLCSDAEWQEYLTIIQKLEESVDPQKPFERVTLKHIGPDAAIERLGAMVAPMPGAGAAMRFVASEGSILVIDSTPAQLEQIQAFVQEIDVPWTIEQRIFEIKHKEPAEIRAAIEALISTPTSSPARASTRRRVPGVPGGQPAAGPPTVTDGLTIVELGNKLVVRATPSTLEEVASLIAQFDVADTQTEMRVYGDFPPGTDILSLSETVKTIVAGAAGTPRGRRAPMPDPTGSDGMRFVPYPPANKLIVIAEPSLFDEIERVLELFRSAADAPAIEVAFVKLKYGDPLEVIEQVGPLLDIKIRRMVQSGEMDVTADPATPATPAVPGGGAAARRRVQRPSGVAAGERYHLAADATNQRIVIAAQRSVIEVATDLIKQFDMPTEEDEILFRTVTLNNSDTGLMVKAVKDMVGSSVRTARQRRPASPGAVAADMAGASLTVTEAPTGGAIILRGTKKDVEEATAWIKQLDSMVTSGQIIKVFDIRRAEIKSLVELILHMVDTGPRAQPGRAPAPAPPRRGGTLGGIDSAPEESVWETSKTWVAPDLFIQADLIDKTLLVATTEIRMARIETIIRQVDEDETITRVMEETRIPSFAYELEFADPIDAVWDADSVFREFYPSSDRRPKCRSAMFADNVIVCEYPEESEFDLIRERIRTFVDKPSKKDLESRTLSVRGPEGITAEEVVRRIMLSRPEIDIKVFDITKAEVDYDIEEIRAYRSRQQPSQMKKEEQNQRSESRPSGCVLPGAFGRLVTDLALSLPVLHDDDPPDDDEDYPDDSDQDAEEPESYEAPPERPASQDEMIQRMVQSQFVPAGTDRPKSEADDEDGGEPASPRLPAEAQKVEVYYDNIAGVLVFKGPRAIVEGMKDVIKEIEDELDKFLPPPDIRIYRVRYIDVFTARDIIEEMFNATRMQRDMVQQQQQMQMLRMQQMRQQQIARQRALQQQQTQQQTGRGQQPGQPGRPGEDDEDQQPQLETPQLPPTTVRVYPNPRDRTLILRADASQYPAILELLAKIDQPKPFDSELKIFPLQKLNAVDVEETLKNLLGIGGPSARRTPATPPRPQRGAAAQMGPSAAAGSADALPRTILQEVATGTGVLGIDPEDITLSSNEVSNSIVVMAPPRAIEFIGELIEQLEGGDIPTREIRYFELSHAPVEEVVDYLTEHFAVDGRQTTARGAAGQRTARGGPAPAAAGTGGSLNAPTFLAYPRLNMLTVQAPLSVLDEVADLIAKLDMDSAQQQWEDIILKHADAKLVADTLTQMFGEGGAAAAPGRRSGAVGATSGPGRDARFIGEEGGRIVLYRAPTALREQIQDAVVKLEETAKQTSSIHVLTLENAIPSRVAEAIESAYGAGRGAGARRGGGATTAQFTVTAHDASKQLFVRSDEAMFAEIESLVKTLDTPASLGFDFRIYPLQYADAREVHATMTQLVRGYLTQLGPAAKDVAPFSVEVNEAANALIVLGGPQVFGFLEENLKKIDNPAAAHQREVHVVTLTTADAASVARTLTDIFITGAGQRPGGTSPPPVSISAVQGSPTVLIKCSKELFAQIEPVVQQLDSEEAAAGEVRVVTLLYTDANEMNKALQDTLQKQGGAGGRAGQQLIGGVRVSPLAQGNALVISGNKEQVENLEVTIRQLDASGEKGSVPQIIVLQHARVAHVLPTLQEMFGQRTGGPRGQQPPVIAANDPLNALVIRASQTDMAAIEGMIARIDTPDFPSQPGIRVVQLQQGINITDLAQKVEASVNSGAKARDPKSQKTITITPDTRTNSLILSGSGELFAEAEELARTMEEMGPSGGRETRIITVNNVQVDEIERLIQQLTGQAATGGPGASRPATRPRTPAAQPQRQRR